MSTSILYHAFGLKGIHSEATHYLGDSVLISCRMLHEKICCPRCEAKSVSMKGQKRRFLQLSPMRRKRCFLDLLLHRLRCRECGHLWWPHPAFVEGKHRYVRSFALTVLDLLKFGTIRSVAEYLGVGWDLVKEYNVPRKLDSALRWQCGSGPW